MSLPADPTGRVAAMLTPGETGVNQTDPARRSTIPPDGYPATALVSASVEQSPWRRERPLPPPDPPIYLDLPRVALVAAALLLAAGSLIPWAVGADAMGRPLDYRATEGTGEGVVLIGAGVLLLFLARDRLMWETASRTVQYLPIIVVLLGAAMWIGVENYAGQMIDGWRRNSGTGELTIARYLVLGGMGLAVLAFGWLEWKRPAEVRARMRPLVVELGLTRWSAASVVLALIFGALGSVLSVLAILSLAGMQGMLPAIILGVFGMFGGIAVGSLVSRWLESRLGRR